jgi:DNA polymerase
MKYLICDLETYSETDLAKCGVYRYCEDPSFEILLYGWAAGDRPVRCEEGLSDELLKYLLSPDCTKIAHNAEFELACLSKRLGVELDPAEWMDTMFWAQSMGLPASLDSVGEWLGIEHEKMKAQGTQLINYFSKPCKPTMANGKRLRNQPEHNPEKWEQYKGYNTRDVEAERDIFNILSRYTLPDSEWQVWRDTIAANRRGVQIDRELALSAVSLNAVISEKAVAGLQGLGIDNPNSVTKFRAYLASNGDQLESINKKELAAARDGLSEKSKEALALREEISGASVKKYQRMLAAANSDGRARGLFVANGARTGRYTSRLIQLQNLYRCTLGPEGLKEARERVKRLEGSAQDLKECIRTALIPKKGYKFVVGDFSQIEARLAAYVAGEEWALEAYRAGRDLYSETAARMFGVPYEDIAPKDGKSHDLRQKGKQTTLSAGYGGSVGALIKMGALEMGLSREELPSLVQSWRRANPHIVRFWATLNRACMDALQYNSRTQAGSFAAFRLNGPFLQMGLASGRCISFFKPEIGQGMYGPEATYMHVNQTTRQTERAKLYGGKLFENLIQALARDILVLSMRNLEKAGFEIVGTVHDEVICEAELGSNLSAELMEGIMRQAPKWAKGLPLDAEAWEGDFYRK